MRSADFSEAPAENTLGAQWALAACRFIARDCNNVEVSADQWPDDVRLSDLEPLIHLPGFVAVRELRSGRILNGNGSKTKSDGSKAHIKGG